MNQKLNKEIGKTLRERREYLDLTREKLCGIVDISPQFLSEVERGVKGLSVDKFAALCNGLGLSADYVLWGREDFEAISPIAAMLAMLDQPYLSLAEDMLKAFFQAVVLKQDGN
ncbi:MAG: helix-turn-helix domain-containing protein [Desulfovibrionaceae bacterium]|nr:helix-turn-helix domain-containing protein [Desulfovibrionaceae bacterium]